MLVWYEGTGVDWWIELSIAVLQIDRDERAY